MLISMLNCWIMENCVITSHNNHKIGFFIFDVGTLSWEDRDMFTGTENEFYGSDRIILKYI